MHCGQFSGSRRLRALSRPIAGWYSQIAHLWGLSVSSSLWHAKTCGCCAVCYQRLIRLCMRVQIGNRIIRKRIHVRIEHVTPSRCREEFLASARSCQRPDQARGQGAWR